MAVSSPVEMGWPDVGSWDALWEVCGKDGEGNVLQGDVIAIDTRSSLIRSDTSQTIATVGVADILVVATRDAVLVMPRDRAQDAKLVETTDLGDRFQTKRIVVKPGQQLSLQRHHHRSSIGSLSVAPPASPSARKSSRSRKISRPIYRRAQPIGSKTRARYRCV